MPGYTEESGVRLLTLGVDRNGGRPRPPMRPFRFSPRSVVAYLKGVEAPSEP
jgi:hypothetical protein